eukprot:Em0017g353a
MDALKNVSEAKELLIQLEREEAVLREELDLLLEQQSQMDVKMTSFQKMLYVAQISLAPMKSGVCIVEESDDVIDLKSCVDGVQRAMDAGDYEQAAGHVHRYLALDESILLDTITDLMKGSSSSTVSVSFELRREAEARLKDLVRSKFNEASSCSDSSSLERYQSTNLWFLVEGIAPPFWGGREVGLTPLVTLLAVTHMNDCFICGVGSKSCYALVCPFFGSALRFFKVFPLLNLHEEGLKLLNGHLSKLVREGAQKNLHVAAEAKAALPWKPPYVVT